MSKVTQIVTGVYTDRNGRGPALYALTEDGRVWRRRTDQTDPDIGGWKPVGLIDEMKPEPPPP